MSQKHALPGNLPEEMVAEYSKMEERVPFMEHIEARARKWSILTGWKDDEHPGSIEEQYGGHVRIATEMQLEEAVVWLSEHPAFRHMAKNFRRMKPEKIQEAIDSTAVEPFVTYALAMVRQLVPALFAQGLVAIQPTPSPNSKVFYLRWTRGNTKPTTTAGDRVDIISNFDRFYAGWGSATTALVGDGSTTDFDLETSSVVADKVVVYKDGTKLATGYTILSGSGTDGVDQIHFSVAPANAAQIVVNTPTYAEGDTPRDIDLTMASEQVDATDFALRVGWDVQAEQDFSSVHGLSVESELTKALTYECLAELDFNILQFLLHWAGMSGAGNVNWNSTGYLAGDVASDNRKAYEETLHHALIEADDLIWAANNGRARSAWMVCGANASQRLRKINSFVATTPVQLGGPGGQADGASGGAVNTMGIERRTKIGTLDSKWTVYVAPTGQFPTDKILLGYKGASPFHLSAVFAPYRMMYFTPAMDDPQATFKKKKGVLSRAALHMVNKQAYSTVTIT